MYYEHLGASSAACKVASGKQNRCVAVGLQTRASPKLVPRAKCGGYQQKYIKLAVLQRGLGQGLKTVKI